MAAIFDHLRSWRQPAHDPATDAAAVTLAPSNAGLLRVGCLLFLAGSALAATGFHAVPAAATLLSVCCWFYVVWSNRPGPLLAAPIDWRWLGVCLAIALAVSLLGGQGHLVFAKDDWLTRDAVLADISTRWLPVIYAIDGADYLLRAPIGMYLAPGAVGHAFGLGAAHVAQLVQNTAIFGVFLYIVTLVWPQRRLAFIFLFLLFAGLSVIPVLLSTQGEWLPHYLVFWSAHWNYTGNLSQYLWNPNHTLPGWWFAALAVLYAREEIDLATLAAATAPMALWSPLALISAVPIFALLALQAPRQMLTPRFAIACLALLGYLPVLSYLVSDSAQVEHEWLVFKDHFVVDYLYFVVFSLPLVYFATRLSGALDARLRVLLFASFALLLLLPLYRIGVNAVLNDLTQKGSIIPQAIAAFAFAAVLLELFATRQALLAGAGVMLATVAAAEPALEVYDSLGNPRYAISDCNFLTHYWKLTAREELPSAYVARLDHMPGWIRRDGEPLREENRQCWPDRPRGDKRFNYLLPENRVWLRAAPPSARHADAEHRQ